MLAPTGLASLASASQPKAQAIATRVPTLTQRSPVLCPLFTYRRSRGTQPATRPSCPSLHPCLSLYATACPRSPPQIKSYLSGSPPIRLGLSENLILGRRDQRMLSSYGSDAGACCFQGAISLLRRPVLDPLLLLAAPRHRRPEHALLLSARACACACICGAPT